MDSSGSVLDSMTVHTVMKTELYSITYGESLHHLVYYQLSKKDSPLLLVDKQLSTSKAQSHLWEANSFSASEEIRRILRNPKVHNRVHNSHMFVPVQSQTNPARVLPSYFYKQIV